MQIDVTYVIVLIVGLLIGSGVSIPLSIRIWELRHIRRVLRIKNPEMWELKHFEEVDRTEEQTTRRVKKPS